VLSFLVTLTLAFQVKAAVPNAHRNESKVRIVFIGGEWSAGQWAKNDESVPSRFRRYLEEYLKAKVEIRTAQVSNLASLPVQINFLLKDKIADYVFYLCDHSGVPVTFASEQLAPWNPMGDRLSNYLGKQIGAIRLAMGMRKSTIPEDVLLQPFTDLMRRSSGAAIRFGAKFVLLWPGFPITQMSWATDIPNHWPNQIASYLDYIKTKPLVSSERLMLHLRRNNIPYVANLQVSRYFSSIRQKEPDKVNAAIWSPQAADAVAKMLATSVVSTEF
jgi:hypothetical protein